MKPYRFTIERDGHKLTATIVWTEELGCFIGVWDALPIVRRTGVTLGCVLDALTELENNVVGAVMGVLYGEEGGK